MPDRQGKASDRFIPLSLTDLHSWITAELKTGSVFGIPESLFYRPSINDNFRIKMFGRILETPVGLAAGPHTQLAQNIVCGWLTGARYIELKTIQDQDQIEVTKPCIDMREEGYNCEWSQELDIDHSYEEYLKAWILIHILTEKLGFQSGADPGFIFNMSAGYDLAGIRRSKVNRFLKKMRNPGNQKEEMLEGLYSRYPDLARRKIPDMVSDNITVSTMHGTPPDEIEKIGEFFIGEKGLHTIIKLNPTLAGPEKVREVINRSLGYETAVPDSAFGHDILYPDALRIVRKLREFAGVNDLFFGVKLTNTLECLNPGDILPEKEKMAYMSGKALHPLSVHIAARFRQDINDLDISFAGGADAFNVSDILACGIFPVTMCSDLLRPGGYTRIPQYLENISSAVRDSGTEDIHSYILKKSGGGNTDITAAALSNIAKYEEISLNLPDYRKEGFRKKNTKTGRGLTRFDCIKAPCTDSCGTAQDVPRYLFLTAERRFSEAFETVFATNSLPSVTGMVCDHLCQSKCTRSNYDRPLKIREIKRFLAENHGNVKRTPPEPQVQIPIRVAVIGAGPSGISCARHLSDGGFSVTLYERDPFPGGMAEKVIPGFRLGTEALKNDLDRLTTPDIKFVFNKNITFEDLTDLIREYKFVYIAIGAQERIRLEIDGIDSPGIIDPIGFLSEAKKGKLKNIGKNIAVIGGGNTAIDSARTALRAAGEGGAVTILYRRTKAEMPAETEEIQTALGEGVRLIEQAAPVKVLTGPDGRVGGLVCMKTRQGTPDHKGRRYPVMIEGSEFRLDFDTVIPAVGQRPEQVLTESGAVSMKRYGRLMRSGNVLAGGDAGYGNATVVNAVGDGREAAELIMREFGITASEVPEPIRSGATLNELRMKRARRMPQGEHKNPGPEEKMMPLIPEEPLSEEEAVKEAGRCLSCDELCDICVTVCPNRANIPYRGNPSAAEVPFFGIKGGETVITGYERLTISQENQVLHLTDFCNHCGNCTTFCPTSGSPFLDKPRISLSKEGFESNRPVFAVYSDMGMKCIVSKDESGKMVSMKESGESLICSSENYSLKLNGKNLSVISVECRSGPVPDMKTIFAMTFLIRSVPAYLFDLGKEPDLPFLTE